MGLNQTFYNLFSICCAGSLLYFPPPILHFGLIQLLFFFFNKLKIIIIFLIFTVLSVSAIQQRESVIITHTFLVLPTSLPSSHPISPGHRRAPDCSLCRTATALQLRILPLTRHRCGCPFLLSSHTLSLPHCVHRSILYMGISIPALKTGPSIPLF